MILNQLSSGLERNYIWNPKKCHDQKYIIVFCYKCMDRLPRIVKNGLFFPSEREVLPKSVYKSKGGEIGIPDFHLTTNLLMTQKKKKDDFLEQWKRDYDFHFADLEIEINPNQNFDPYYVKLEGEMNPTMPMEKRPSAKDIFPKTEFVHGNFKIEGNFVASASAGFHQEEDFNSNFGAGIEGEAKIIFKYVPLIAAVNSGTAGSTFHWTFQKAEGKEPIGGLGIKMIIERPREVKDMHIIWKVLVQFHKKWHGDDVATIPENPPATTKLAFKESQFE